MKIILWVNIKYSLLTIYYYIGFKDMNDIAILAEHTIASSVLTKKREQYESIIFDIL